jgi:hypothetical protein
LRRLKSTLIYASFRQYDRVNLSGATILFLSPIHGLSLDSIIMLDDSCSNLKN